MSSPKNSKQNGNISPEDVLRRMLTSPPKPHAIKPKKKPKK